MYFFRSVNKNRRIQFLCLALSAFSILIFIKGALLQIFPSTVLIKTKKKLFEKVVSIKARRGAVYDRYGRELALSVSSHSLFADPSLIKNTANVSSKLSKLLKIPRKKLLNKIKNKKKRFVWIKRHISDQEKNKILSWNIYGLGLIEEPKRVYPNGPLMSQVLGFTGSNGQGLEGIELMYDELLRGVDQKVLTPKDARGRPLFIDGGLFIEKSRGSDIYLTIDSDLQFVLERELAATVKKFEAKSAMGLVLSAQNSEILAIAHFPNFNPNTPFKYKTRLYRNRIASDILEPGSTFKTFIAAAALKENIPPHTQFESSKGSLKIGKHVIREAEPRHQYGKLSISEILSVSSNIGAARLALRLTDHVLYSVLREFGFGEKTGVDFPLEGKGILKSPPWRNILTGTIGFGQGVSATALQITAAYAAIANQGVLNRPYILHSTVDLSGRKTLSHKPKILGRPLTKDQAQALTFMLTQAVSREGTGFKAQVEGFLTAGKTGTSQKPDLKKGGYIKGKYISSFAGFVPADRPQFVIYVAVDEPQKKFYGSTVAAPVFSAVGSYAVRRAGLLPSFVKEPHVLVKEDVKLKKPFDQKLSDELTPDFRGLSLRQAFQKAKNMNLKLKIQGSGLVQKTIPSSGKLLPQNRTVKLMLDQ